MQGRYEMEMRFIQFLGGNHGDTEIMLWGWVNQFHFQYVWVVD